eukprot:CAMPEP_0114173648 /NCGR_PEP_ID=MMETSP0043_2-20121206/35960_1 /TAXON_ID=464988 /ORGANISM="Hemiselmis andersenii, Strain CCMP644" /LENGTH=88 /DNA_ID=CAMNT_0001271683 /DNA_START=532 /DNA_END=795 /DNA_ORIENTATION=-
MRTAGPLQQPSLGCWRGPAVLMLGRLLKPFAILGVWERTRFWIVLVWIDDDDSGTLRIPRSTSVTFSPRFLLGRVGASAASFLCARLR